MPGELYLSSDGSGETRGKEQSASKLLYRAEGSGLVELGRLVVRTTSKHPKLNNWIVQPGIEKMFVEVECVV